MSKVEVELPAMVWLAAFLYVVGAAFGGGNAMNGAAVYGRFALTCDAAHVGEQAVQGGDLNLLQCVRLNGNGRYAFVRAAPPAPPPVR